MPVAQPLAAADYVLIRTPAALYGVNFANGRLEWRAGPIAQQQPDRSQSAAVIRANGGIIFNGQDPSLTDKLWENATYSTLASDGDYVFEVEEVPDSSGIPQIQQRRIFRPGMVGGLTDNPTNELAAYNLHTQGKIVWKVGGEKKDHDVEPQLTGAFFLGPPLPLLGRLYVLAEIKGEIRLVVLDSKTGKMDWSQQLASPEEANVLGSGFRRATGVSPSYADGVLICPTSAGAIVAVDIANRSLLWGYEYPHGQQNQIQQQQMMQIRMGRVVNAYNMQNFMGDRWSDATATIADGCVIVTPVESEELFCLSLIDGKLLWKMDRGENVYVAGMRDGKVLLVGRKQVQAYSIGPMASRLRPGSALASAGSVPSGARQDS